MTNSTQSETKQYQKDSDAEASYFLRPLHELGIQLIFPAIVLAFIFLYIANTYGELELSSLVYPYTIISSLTIFILGILVSEISSYRSENLKTNSSERSESEFSVVQFLRHNKNSLIVAGAAIAYPGLIEIAGFFPASVIVLIGLMRSLGVDDWKKVTLVTILLLAGIYAMFVQVLGLRVPQGIMGV